MCQVGQYICSDFSTGDACITGLGHGEVLISPFFTPNPTKVDRGGGESNRRNPAELIYSRSNTQNDRKGDENRLAHEIDLVKCVELEEICKT